MDEVFEPFMAGNSGMIWQNLFGAGKGSGAALLFFLVGIAGVAVCLVFHRVKCIWELDKDVKIEA